MKQYYKTMENLVFAFLVAMVILFVYLYHDAQVELKTKQRSLDYFHKTFLSRQGATSLYNGNMLNYNLQSFDSGKTWYACEYDKDWKIKILGEADEVYPGLIKNLDAWDKITDYVEKHGAIGSKPITPELEQIMGDANLKVVKTK